MRGDRFSAPSAWEALWPLLDEADGDVRLVGGGTWVVPELQRGREPVHIVSLRRLPLNRIGSDAASLRLGATTTYAALLSSSLVRIKAPMLWDLAGGVTGGPQIRSQGTIGGAAVAARPQSDIPAALCALDATAVLVSRDSAREVPIGEFFLDAQRSDVRPGEVLAEIAVPSHLGNRPWGHGYVKIKGAASSWPIVTAAAALWAGDDGAVSGHVSVGGLGRRPLTVDLAVLLGVSAPTPDAVSRGDGLTLPEPAEPWEDELAPADYRSAVAPVAVRRALKQACSALLQKGGLP